ncbi:MAG: LysM peptidoglycan-binding domain-containing protein [Gemmatimonadetes bacterium]|nr:LysM peptidoglycan-binding domain-containing protein [Gemmatimonadota bacterium]
MTRSAAALLALLILPGIAQSQEQQRPATHEVVDGETLWNLAQRYYQNPYLWPRIYEANRGVVEDPHWIYPGETLVIPDVTTTVVDVAVVAPGQPAPGPRPLPPVDPGPAADERTVFWPRERGGFIAAEARENLPVVARDVFYSAPWLVPPGATPPSIGSLGALVGAEEERRRTYFTYDRVQVLSDAALRTGTSLQVFRIVDEIEGVGQIAVPTGVVTVSEQASGVGVVALVVDEFDRMTPGDLVRPLPEYGIRPGVQPSDVAAGPAATVVGFAQPGIQGIYDIAFLDRGANAGVSVGDEYVLMWREDPDWPPTVEGRLQVVSVEPGNASARIMGLNNPVFESGLTVVLSRKMP